MFVTARSFPLRHAFSTREGGVSEGPFAALNLGRSVGDDPERVEQNGRLFAAALGLSAGQLVSADQVHGDRILEIAAATPGDALPPAVGEADGLITRARGVALCIRTADCVPVLVWAPDVGAIAAVHAGWRGAVRAIARSAVERLHEAYGADPARMVAAIGPSIRRCCYEVSGQLAGQFTQRFGVAVAEAQGGRPHLDVAEASRLALLEAGLEAAAIEVAPHCTSCDPALFFSHRRDRGRTGRHLACVVL
jgi:YfiH family protein